MGNSEMRRTVCLLVVLMAFTAVQASDEPDDDLDFENDPAGVEDQMDHSVDQMSRLLKVKDAVDVLSAIPLGEREDTGEKTDVRSLGDTNEKVPALPVQRSALDSQLLSLESIIVKYGHRTDLGEGGVSREINLQKLRKLMHVKSDQDQSQAVMRVVTFLTKELSTGASLTKMELDEVQKFYVSETADALATFGYEDSEYGNYDASSRRGDAMAARKHMEHEDLDMRMQEAGLKIKDDAGAKIVPLLAETANLSRFLAQLTHESAHKASVEDEHLLDKTDQHDNLERLEADEEAVTDGIEQLLKHAEKLTKHVELTKNPTENVEHAKKSKEAKKKVVKVSAPRLKYELNSEITDKLDQAIHTLGAMQQNGSRISPAMKEMIRRYLNGITGHLLKAYLSYGEWTDREAVQSEAKAVQIGDPEAPSRIQVGLKSMSPQKVVEHFLADSWHHPTQETVPVKVQRLMQQDIALPNGGHVMIIGWHGQ